MAKIQKNHKRQLSQWIGGEKSLSLLYQASRDGCNPQVFHQKCDNQGATVTLCYNTAGYVFGGYTALSWTSSQGYWAQDPAAFLFRLTGGGYPMKKYPLKGQTHSVYHNATYGPSFGGGHDLCTFINTVAKNGNYFQGNSANIGSSYDLAGDTAQMFTGSNLLFTDIMVFQVTDDISDGKRKRDFGDAPWRKISSSNCKDLMKQIEQYSPPEDSKVKAVNLLLIGPVGAGKSSIFNSINSIFQREITALARSGSAERSLTTAYRRYRVRSSETGATLKLRLCDTRGLETDGGLDLVDLMAVVEGHVPDRFQFNPTVPISGDCTGYNSSPGPDDKIHCVVFVLDGTTVDVFPDKLLQMIKSLQQRLNAKGLPQVVLITKTDKVCQEVHENVRQMFNSATIGDLVDQAGQLLGLQRSCIFPVKNYEEEMEVDDDVSLHVLLCLKHMLRFATDYIMDSETSD